MSVLQRWILVTLTSMVVLAGGAVAWVELAASTEAVPAASASPLPSTPTTTADGPTTAEEAASSDAAVPTDEDVAAGELADTAVPESSGSGRRVVFSIERQRIWWVGDDDVVIGTAPVSGRADTPAVGTFSVYSKTEHATGLDGTKMAKFVRFTKGPNGWAIGFHGIPTDRGVPVQTEEQLGEPLSHGCIRQGAFATDLTWEFLDVGDAVVVVA